MKENIDLNKRIKVLAKQKCNPQQLLQTFNEIEQNGAKYDIQTYFLVQQALIKVHCQNKHHNSALKVWNSLFYNDECKSILQQTDYQYHHAMTSFLDCNYPNTVLTIFNQMIQNKVKPREKNFNIVISAVAKLKSSEKANEIYQILHENHPHLIQNDKFIQNGLINMYLSYGDVVNAQRIFHLKSNKQEADTWCVLINGMIENGKYEESIELFDEMIKQNIKLDCYLYACITKTISNLKLLDKAYSLYEMIEKDPNNNVFDDAALCCSLMIMFAKCGDVAKTMEIWNFIQENRPNLADILTWNAMMRINYYESNYQEVLNLYKQLITKYHDKKRVQQKMKIKPQLQTFSVCIDACTKLKDIEFGKQIYKDVKEIVGSIWNRNVYNGLINMFCECGDIDETINIWRELMHDMQPTDAKFNYIIKICVDHGYNLKAFELFDEMQNKYNIKPNMITFICILKACGKHEELIKKLHEKIMCADKKIYNNRDLIHRLMTAYQKCGNKAMTIKVWKQYQSNKKL